MSSDLPNSVRQVLDYLAVHAAGYGNRLQRAEVAKFKGDLMNAPDRWAGVRVEAVESYCLAAGMRPEDVQEIADALRKRRAGRRLRPSYPYAKFRFAIPLDPPVHRSSRDW